MDAGMGGARPLPVEDAGPADAQPAIDATDAAPWDAGPDASIFTDAGSTDAGPDAASGPPSCRGLSANCGRFGNESCCKSPLVVGGEFARNYDAQNGGLVVYPGRVSDFRLDKFEVTVGRFRRFVSAWIAGWRPNAGDGKHRHLHAGEGLASTLGGYESGWNPGWSAQLATTKEAWDRNLACNASHPTWSSAPGDREQLPINCATWYEQYAFCIWDGGFLPSLTERNYAGSGGNEQRFLPWSMPPASTISDGSYAVYCGGDDCGLRAVGSKSPKGDGRYGQADLAGNVFEATLDKNDRYGALCDDCIQWWDDSAVARLTSGGSFLATESTRLMAWLNLDVDPAFRDYYLGVRCAREPSAASEADTEPTRE